MTWVNAKELLNLWAVAKNLADFNFDEASDLEKVYNYLDRLENRPLQRSYVYEKAPPLILDVIEANLGRPTQKISREVNNWCRRRARDSGKDELQYPKQAGYVTSIEMRGLWNTLFVTGKPKPIESAIAFGLCYCTGARMGEVLALRIEDTKTIQDEGEFIRFFIRSSKTDPFNKRMETLNLPTSIEHIVPIVSEIRRLMRGRREGLVFAKLNGSTRMASDYIGRYRKLAGIETRITAHSGRVSFYIAGRRSGETQQTMSHTLRWTHNSAMPAHYERCYLETKEDGAPTAVAKARLKELKNRKRPNQKAHCSTAEPVEDSDSDTSSSDESDKENIEVPGPSKIQPATAPVETRPDAPVEKPIETEPPKEDPAPARRTRNVRKPARFRESED